ncbi:MAG: HAMP domain-containing histidine kinase [Robiginitomaculum sp.]|nr:HAMP domain-containing histidine kinase [Robiginitomaculum sp.]
MNFVLHLGYAKARTFAMPVTWLVGLWAILGFIFVQTNGSTAPILGLVGLIASVPALIHVGLGRFLDEEWAQALVLVSWSAFAGLAIASPGNVYTPFIGFAILPIVAAVSLGGMRRALEASVLSVLIIIAITVAGTQGLLPRNSDFLQTVPVLELAGLILSLLVMGAGLAVVLPLLDAQARLRDALFRKSPHKDFCVDQSGRIICASNLGHAWNPAKTLSGLLTTEENLASVNATLEQVFHDNMAASMVIAVGPAQKAHSLVIRPLDDKLAMLSLRDISAQIAKEQQLTAERDEAIAATHDKTMFLAGMSHELRTPLNAIIGFSDMMKARLFGPIPAKYAEYADLIHESGCHLVDLVGDVLDMSKIESDHYTLTQEAFDLSDVVRSCVKLMQMSADGAGVRLQVQLPEVAVPVNADRKAMRQILFNLLSNAIKFTPSGGQVITSIELGAAQVILQVEDNGVGMSSDDASKVGQPFQQANSAAHSDARGTGLGLSLVKALTELHKGTFEVASELGQGTRICLTLPVLDTRKIDPIKVQALDVRAHIRRAQEATEQIAAISARISG